MKAGFVAVAGRPNVGKSTLFNRLLGPELSIVSHRQQTTRYCVRGIVAAHGSQMALVDTPGWQDQHGGALNAALRRRAEAAVPAADACLLVVEGTRLRPADRAIAARIPASTPTVIAFNKLDVVRRREELLPAIEQASSWRECAALVPVSAATGEGLDALMLELAELMPASPFLFPPGMLTDMPDRFFAAEFVREQLFRLLGEELPYAVAVEVRSLEQRSDGCIAVAADIIVDQPSRQAIVVGAGGANIKRIGTGARRKFERYAGARARFDLRVVVRRKWHSQPGQLARLGLLERGPKPEAAS